MVDAHGQVWKVLYYENYDNKNVVMPVKYRILNSMLKQANYDEVKRTKIVKGFKEGFRLGYNGSQKVRLRAPNLKLSVGDEIILWNKVMKEVSLKRYAGPYQQISFDYFIQSPIGLVPKDNGKDVRLIFHLSYPRNFQSKKSVNTNIPENLTRVSYLDFNKAIFRYLEECGTHKSHAILGDWMFPQLLGIWEFLLMTGNSLS